MATFKDLEQTEKNEHFKKVFAILAESEGESTGVKDGAEVIALDSSQLYSIRDELYQVEKENRTQDGTPIQSATEMRASIFSEAQKNIRILKDHPELVKDGYYNPVSGIGTYIDPGIQQKSFIPVSITPEEGTAYYTSGGIPARIIDKKAGSLLLNGVNFQCDMMTPEDLATLKEYSERTGFPDAFRDGVTQALIFGGSVVYPALTGDTPTQTQKSKADLLAAMPEKNFIRYWVTTDRWNVVFIPEYNITAQDYLYSKSVFVPIGGVRVNTSRMAMIRPRRLPFWGAIRQMGWSTSDFEGWIKDYESYEIMKASLPIMAQQMSLMYHSFPADGMIIENGPEYAKQFFAQNEEQMRGWSMLHPKAINSVGEIKILERTYTGFKDLITESRLALCSSSAIPESILFAEKATGLASDNRDDIALKQSEVIRLLFNAVSHSFQPCISLMVASCFGKSSEQAKHASEVTIAPDTAIMLSDTEKSQLGINFSSSIAQLVASGLPVDVALEIAQQFTPSVTMTEDITSRLEGIPEIEQGTQEIDQSIWSMISQAQDKARRLL